MQPRRYYLLKRFDAAARGDEELALAFRAKQEAEVAPALPSDFPHRAALVAGGYGATADLEGATRDELADHAGLGSRAADAVIAAAKAALGS